MKPARLELHIEEIVLHGFSPADRSRVGEAVEQELSRLFVERGVPPSLVWSDETARLDGGAFEAKPGFGAVAIGVRIARAVYGGLDR